MKQIGIVAIGRNEGQRLRLCLESIVGNGRTVVYVDSGSTDSSVELARQLGANVVALDVSVPFTAARARNVGLQRLCELDSTVEYVQFVDGDCEVVDGWLAAGAAALDTNPRIAVVDGRRRERFRDGSPYNRLCDLEWDAPLGEARACGGDALMRVEALRQIGGYNPALIAGEEPELCVRLRAAGWKVLRIGAEMTVHDAAMTRFRQWRRRAVRAGHAFAEGAFLHGRLPERHWVQESRSVWLWAFWVPLLAIAPAAITHGWSLLLLLGYPILAWRIWGHCRRRQLSAADTRLFVIFTILGKFPQFLGQLHFWTRRLLDREGRLIEYKGPSA
jgi:GT2 family glycosyltransferase